MKFTLLKIVFIGFGILFTKPSLFAQRVDDCVTAKTYLDQGVWFIRNHKNDSAIVYFTKAIQLDSKYVSAYWMRCNTLYLTGNYKEALSDVNKLMEMDSMGNIKAFYNLRGGINYKLKKYQAAANDFTAAIQISPKFSEAFLGRSETYRKLGKTKLAEADARIASVLMNDPSNEELKQTRIENNKE